MHLERMLSVIGSLESGGEGWVFCMPLMRSVVCELDMASEGDP